MTNYVTVMSRGQTRCSLGNDVGDCVRALKLLVVAWCSQYLIAVIAAHVSTRFTTD